MASKSCKSCEDKLNIGANDALHYCYLCSLEKKHRDVIKENFGVDMNNLRGN